MGKTNDQADGEPPVVKPLQGLRVVDLSQGIAGPSAAMYCASWGADVVKVEPLGGDWIRGLGQSVGEFSPSTLAYNASKRSLAIDLKHPAAAAVMDRLFKGADAVIQSFRPGVADRLGLGFDAVARLQPHVVYLSISGFGASGPWADRPCTDTVAQAFSGFMSLNQGLDGVPHKINTTIIDAITGLYAYQMLSMRLVSLKSQSGERPEACHLDASLMESAAAILAPNIIDWSLSGGAPTLLNAPAGSFRTEDGWIAITLVRESQFEALAKAIELPELATDERYSTFARRAENIDTLRATMNGAISGRTTAEWCRRCKDNNVLASPIHDIGEWLGHDQVKARGAAATMPLGPGIDARAPLLRAAGFERPTDYRSPSIGEHSVKLLTELGFDRDEINTLVDSSCVGAPGGQIDDASAGSTEANGERQR